MQRLRTPNGFQGRAWRRSGQVCSRPEVFRREHIHDVVASDEAVAQPVVGLLRGEPDRLQPPSGLLGCAGKRPDVHERVQVPSRAPRSAAVLAFEKRDHLAADQDPWQPCEEIGDLVRDPPEPLLCVVAGDNDDWALHQR